MFGLGPATKIYVGLEAVDMRKGFEGLFGLVRDYLGQDPMSGHLFLFGNRERTRLKAVIWDGSGLWVCAKRLERGRFQWPKADPGERQVTMRPEQLTFLLNGMDLEKVRFGRTGCAGKVSQNARRIWTASPVWSIMGLRSHE